MAKRVMPSTKAKHYFESRGWEIGLVERYIKPPNYKNPGMGIRFDLFGFIDLIAINPQEQRIYGVQATSDNGGNHSAHVQKILAEPRAKLWIEAGGGIYLVSFKPQHKYPRIAEFLLPQDRLVVQDYTELI